MYAVAFHFMYQRHPLANVKSLLDKVCVVFQICSPLFLRGLTVPTPQRAFMHGSLGLLLHDIAKRLSDISKRQM